MIDSIVKEIMDLIYLEERSYHHLAQQCKEQDNRNHFLSCSKALQKILDTLRITYCIH